MTWNKDLGRRKTGDFKTRTIEQTDTIVDSIIDQFVIH